jgi:hypothetical protein
VDLRSDTSRVRGLDFGRREVSQLSTSQSENLRFEVGALHQVVLEINFHLDFLGERERGECRIFFADNRKREAEK